MDTRSARNRPSAKAGRPRGAEPDPPADGPGRRFIGSGSPEPCDEVSETGVLLDALIHDLRTPLSAMSGWLEVLESHFGEVEGIVARALLGLRRGVEGQTKTLNGISDVLTKQRVEVPDQDDCVLLEQLQRVLAEMDGRPDSPLGAAELARLEPLRTFTGDETLSCRGGSTSLGDACSTLLHAVAVAQGDGDAPIVVEAASDAIRIRVPGASGDVSALESLASGLRPHAPRRPHIRPQALWLARSVFRRCDLRLRLVPVPEGGLELVIARHAPGAASVGHVAAG